MNTYLPGCQSSDFFSHYFVFMTILDTSKYLGLHGSTFPRALGHMPLDFAVGPRFFSLGAQNLLKNNQKS